MQPVKPRPESFLELTASRILQQCKNQPADACVVFPTRRAALLFRSVLAQRFDKPVLAPEILSINDFINLLAPVPPAEPLLLLFQLYESYKTELPHESFDHFLPWGEMMLRDFNEISIQCINPDKLFASLADLRLIEEKFGFTDEEKQTISAFWREFSMHDPGIVKQAFLKIWEVLPRIFRHFCHLADTRGFAWEGKAYQDILHALENRELTIRWKEIFFCGFFQLTRAHEQLAVSLKNFSNVEFLFDADSYYLNDPYHEAGEAFRRRSPDGSLRFVTDHFLSFPKQITISGCTGPELQAKVAGSVVANACNPETGMRTAIVLPDEKMLLPVINSLPESVEQFNVTMGFPVKDSLTGALIKLLCSFHLHHPNHERLIYCPVLLPVLAHPLLPKSFIKEAHALSRKINEQQLLRIPADELNSGLAGFLFPGSDESGICSYLIRILKQLSSDSRSDSEVENSIAGFIAESLAVYEPMLASLKQEMSRRVEWRVILKIINRLRIPFSGEPVAGLQIMGLLETRALDFDRVIILSANEGKLPVASRFPSFIPFSIRKAFGMPLQAESDSISAYHFYRLIQRASEVHILYDTEGKSNSGGEMSRFITQLIHEVKSCAGPQIPVSTQLITAPFPPFKPNVIRVSKTKSMMEDYLLRLDQTQKGLSASALTSYITCPLQFYFRQVAQLREPDELQEIPGPDVFGRLLHITLQQVYQSKTQLTDSDFEELKSRIPEAVALAEKQIFGDENTADSGFHLLNRQIITSLACKILDTDRQRLPFQISGLEQTVRTRLSSDVPAYGIIDRMQIKDGVIEILDYKSGQAETKLNFEKLFTDPKYKSAFQMMFYAYLCKLGNARMPLRSGLYIMNRLSSGIAFLNDGLPIDDSLFEEFETGLDNLIEEILNPDVPFVQTENVESCRYCPYRNICQR